MAISKGDCWCNQCWWSMMVAMVAVMVMMMMMVMVVVVILMLMLLLLMMIHIFIYSYIHIFIYSYIHIFIHSYIHIFIYCFVFKLYFPQLWIIRWTWRSWIWCHGHGQLRWAVSQGRGLGTEEDWRIIVGSPLQSDRIYVLNENFIGFVCILWVVQRLMKLLSCFVVYFCQGI